MMKCVINDPKTGKSYSVELGKDKIPTLIGKKINDEINGSDIGMQGYTLKITGGSDNSGFPMRADIEGTKKQRILINKGVGIRETKKGKKGEKKDKKEKKGKMNKHERKRKTVRGNTITDSTAQVNAIIIKYGDKSLDEIFKK